MKPPVVLTLADVGNITIQEMTYRQVQMLVAAQASAQQGGRDTTSLLLDAIRPAVALPDGVESLEDLYMSDLEQIIRAVGGMHGFFPDGATPTGLPSSL